MRISDWSADVCSSDLTRVEQMGADMRLDQMDAAVWDRAFQINTRGTMLMIKHAAPHMIANGGGSIINTSTGVALTGDIFNPAYSSSKAAEIGRASCRERVCQYV